MPNEFFHFFHNPTVGDIICSAEVCKLADQLNCNELLHQIFVHLIPFEEQKKECILITVAKDKLTFYDRNDNILFTSKLNSKINITLLAIYSEIEDCFTLMLTKEFSH